jgi:hypothetical protein
MVALAGSIASPVLLLVLMGTQGSITNETRHGVTVP